MSESDTSCAGCFVGCGCILMALAYCIFSFGLVVKAIEFVL